MEQQLGLLMDVVHHIQAAVESCSLSPVWAQQAQQVQDKLQVLRAAVVSGEAGAGRSLFLFSHCCYCCGSCSGGPVGVLRFMCIQAIYSSWRARYVQGKACLF